MLTRKNQYINLIKGSGDRPDTEKLQLEPRHRVIQLGGESWGWIWNRPSGMVIRKGDSEYQFRIFDYTRWITILLFGLSTIIVILGVLKVWEGKRGE